MYVFSKTSHLLKTNETVTLESVKCANILGVEVDSRLSFSEHVDGLCKKAGRHINALSRMSKTFHVPTWLITMPTFSLSQFNFCPSCVAFHVNPVIL